MKGTEWPKGKSLESSLPAENKISDERLCISPICESTQCPNKDECRARGVARFMILGSVCTRDCTFCGVKKGLPSSPDPEEPDNVAEAVVRLSLKYVVITAVSRDDMDDGGAAHFARAIKAVQEIDYNISTEVMVHDFQGEIKPLEIVVDTFPDVINHYIVTVPRLFAALRPKASYQVSLNLLKTVKELNPGIVTKSGLLLGLGEQDYEVVKVMQDLREAGCNSITLGQYLPPSTSCQRVVKCITPQEFEEYEGLAKQMGFDSVRSGPFVRSSSEAIDMYKEVSQ